MNTGLKDSLERLKLEDGIVGVEKLNPADEVSEKIPNPPRKHLHIVIERPGSGEFVIGSRHRISDSPICLSLPLVFPPSRDPPLQPCILPARMHSAVAHCQTMFLLFQSLRLWKVRGRNGYGVFRANLLRSRENQNYLLPNKKHQIKHFISTAHRRQRLQSL